MAKKTNAMDALAGITKSLEDVYDGDAWHGPTVKKVLLGIPASQANAHIGTGHSIIELVLHMAAWKDFATHKLRGDIAFDITEEMNFPKGKNWAGALETLDNSQQGLLSALASFDGQKLESTVPHRKYSFYKLLHGVAHHDLYHLGQIVMIARQFQAPPNNQ